MKVFFVGVHNKPGMDPLDSRTFTGKVVDEICRTAEIEAVKTNLCGTDTLPDHDGIRECACYWQWAYEPSGGDVCVLLGKTVAKYFLNYSGVTLIKVAHPGSLRYGKDKGQYIQQVADLIKWALQISPLPNTPAAP